MIILLCSLEKFIKKRFSMSIEIKIRKNEPIERVLRKLRKKITREDIIGTVREKRYYKKPSAIKREKKKAAAFSNMLRVRYENM